jgi:hypothetical protein
MIPATELQEINRVAAERAEAVASPQNPAAEAAAQGNREAFHNGQTESKDLMDLRKALEFMRLEREYMVFRLRLQADLHDDVTELILLNKEHMEVMRNRINELEQRVMELTGRLALKQFAISGDAGTERPASLSAAKAQPASPVPRMTEGEHNAFPNGRWGTV